MSSCALDTDVVIAALDRQDAHHADAVAGLKGLIAGGTALLISTINYAEALVRPAASDDTLRAAVDAISRLGIEPFPPTASVARDAAHIRGMNVSLADGFCLASAHARRASIASFDHRVRKAAAQLDLKLAL